MESKISNSFKKSSHNTKLIWKNINSAINYKSVSTSHIQSINNDQGIRLTEPFDISNQFNNFFINIGEKLAKSFHNSTTLNHNAYLKPNSSSLFLKPITSTEIFTIINQMKSSKSTPSTEGPISLLKLSAPLLCPFLSFLFNKCLEEGIFPNCLKVAEVKPLFKSGSHLITSNYRPISLLPCLSKVFEKCLYARLSEFLEINQILTPHQFGFRSHCATENAVTKICSEISVAFNRREIACSIFVDMRKAFDTINHKILLDKLKSYGIRGVAFNVFQSYLCDRKQYTIINCVPSEFKYITCGVPQGSVLGPLLFLIYLNDIVNVSKFKVNLFADDSCFTLIDKSPEILEQNVNSELKKVTKWLECNKLTINTDKTMYVIFTGRRFKHDFKIKIRDLILKRKTHAKYLGVTLDEKLSWDPHINQLKKKLSSTVWALSSLRNAASPEILRIIYFGLIHSKLSYCLSNWGAVPQTKKNKIITMQKRAIRIISKAPRLSHSEPLFKNQHIMKVNEMYKHQVATIVSKYIHGLWFGDLNLKNVNEVHDHNTRSSTSRNFFITTPSNEVFKRSLNYAGPMVWREVPQNLKSLHPDKFKLEYKNFLIDKYQNGD